MSNEETVWAETTDGGLLKQLFGYYPTLHDAVLRLIEINPAADLITMDVDYQDMVGEDSGQDMKVRIRLEWRGIESFELPLDIKYFGGIGFKRRGDKIVTSLEFMGEFGSVTSETVEALLVKMDPGDSDHVPWLRYK